MISAYVLTHTTYFSCSIRVPSVIWHRAKTLAVARTARRHSSALTHADRAGTVQIVPEPAGMRFRIAALGKYRACSVSFAFRLADGPASIRSAMRHGHDERRLQSRVHANNFVAADRPTAGRPRPTFSPPI